MSRKASCGRQRAEDKGELRERVLVDEKGTIPLRGGGWVAPLYIHATVNAKTMWFHHNRSKVIMRNMTKAKFPYMEALQPNLMMQALGLLSLMVRDLGQPNLMSAWVWTWWTADCLSLGCEAEVRREGTASDHRETTSDMMNGGLTPDGRQSSAINWCLEYTFSCSGTLNES